MARLTKETILDRFVESFADWPADEQAITIAQLQGCHQATLRYERKAAGRPAAVEPDSSATLNLVE